MKKDAKDRKIAKLEKEIANKNMTLAEASILLLKNKNIGDRWADEEGKIL